MASPKSYGVHPETLSRKLANQLCSPGQRFLPIHCTNLVKGSVDAIARAEGRELERFVSGALRLDSAHALTVPELAYLVEVAVSALIEKGRP
jgi:hypothetical protein